MASRLVNSYGVTESLSLFPKAQTSFTKSNFKFKCNAKNTKEIENHKKNSDLGFKNNGSRRSFLGIASIALFSQLEEVRKCLAEGENNGFWLDGPLPGLPPVQNKIANEETGTRTFLKNGIFMPNIGVDGSAYRLKKYSFDVLAMGDLIGKDAWNYIRRYLRLKGTVMYYDFDKVISAASETNKPPLTNLANRLFDNFEKLQAAVKLKDLPLTESCYQNTTLILQEVMDRMA